MTKDAVLLDLDGTLVDTAPDLVATINHLLREDRRTLLPYALARNEVSNGAIGLVRRAYGSELTDETLNELRARFLVSYAENVCKYSRLFLSLESLINVDNDFYSCWGIVTNKPGTLTDALLAALGIADQPHCVVSGDALAERKPHPAPLLHAAEKLGTEPGRCVYVGDAPRDIEAGRAAGMKTVVAAYGYIRPNEDVQTWGADAIVNRPQEMRSVLKMLRQQDR